jgi:hypothetical protein
MTHISSILSGAICELSILLGLHLLPTRGKANIWGKLSHMKHYPRVGMGVNNGLERQTRHWPNGHESGYETL